MLKPFVTLGAALIVAVFTLAASIQAKLGGKGLPFSNSTPAMDQEFRDSFRRDFLMHTNIMRNEFTVASLKNDPEIEAFITQMVATDENPENIDLHTVFDALQQEFPGAQYLAANLVSAGTRESLLEQLSAWDELAHPEFHEVSTALVPAGRKLVAMSVLSRRIPQFSVEAANNGGGRFFNRCPHCKSVHALDLDRKNKTLILSCPDCERPYDVLAADSQGNMRRAYDFFTGFEIPSETAVSGSKEAVLALWRQVADRCTYEHDQTNFNESEVWKLSDDTWREKMGDCEDTSILLVDALITAGFNARVAIGWNGNIGQHAWVVVDIEGEQFVIESTIQENPTLEDMVPVHEASPFYRPEQLFDRESLYFQNASPEHVSSDYFGDQLWTQVSKS